ncbi:helix-turn-helix domain-containing protein [Oribacterium sp. HCP28S3_H8]|uniref:helix-turn-helix domain-containing protein n=1 Tax=Oribacterium sp. HCP28S3_H8 TaxID=3438945 RepID=UPI003F89C7DD
MQSVAETDNKTDKQIRNAAVGRRIRGARLEKDINQKTLAERVQMDPKYLSRIENGHSGVSRELLLRIGRELGKGLDYFYIDNPELEAAYALDAEFAQKWKQCNKAQKLTILNIMDAVLKSPIRE